MYHDLTKDSRFAITLIRNNDRDELIQYTHVNFLKHSLFDFGLTVIMSALIMRGDRNICLDDVEEFKVLRDIMKFIDSTSDNAMEKKSCDAF